MRLLVYHAVAGPFSLLSFVLLTCGMLFALILLPLACAGLTPMYATLELARALAYIDLALANFGCLSEDKLSWREPLSEELRSKTTSLLAPSAPWDDDIESSHLAPRQRREAAVVNVALRVFNVFTSSQTRRDVLFLIFVRPLFGFASVLLVAMTLGSVVVMLSPVLDAFIFAVVGEGLVVCFEKTGSMHVRLESRGFPCSGGWEVTQPSQMLVFTAAGLIVSLACFTCVFAHAQISVWATHRVLGRPLYMGVAAAYQRALRTPSGALAESPALEATAGEYRASPSPMTASRSPTMHANFASGSPA